MSDSIFKELFKSWAAYGKYTGVLMSIWLDVFTHVSFRILMHICCSDHSGNAWDKTLIRMGKAELLYYFWDMAGTDIFPCFTARC